LSHDRVKVSWTVPSTTSPIQSYRLDVFRQSPSTTDSLSFFGDSEVQILSSLQTQVIGGTFTLAYPDFNIRLPGVVDGVDSTSVFSPTHDLTSFLEAGDKILVGGVIYTVQENTFLKSRTIHVDSVISGSVSKEPIFTLPKTNPIPWDATESELRVALENVPAFGQIDVDRTSVGVGYSWSVTFLTVIGDVETLYLNPRHLLGPDPNILVSERRKGTPPDSYRAIQVSAISTPSAVVNDLETGVAWHFRVLASNDHGDSIYSNIGVAVPA